MEVTIRDIAKLAGVSHSTVSRALNDSPLVNEETRTKIKAIAARLNFEFNSSARSLSGKKTGSVGVIYQSIFDTFSSSLYVNQLFIELRHNLEKRMIDTILIEANNQHTGASSINRLIRQKKVDGFLIVHPYVKRDDYEAIRSADIPIVQLHAKPVYYPIEQLDYFCTHNEAGGKMATDTLLQNGCRKVLNVKGKVDNCDEFAMRTIGYNRSLQEAGIEVEEQNIITCECSFQGGYNLISEYPGVFNSCDGIFFQADIIAFGCLTALKEKGFHVPKDIKIIGFDDTPICTMIHPSLSTIHQPHEILTELACQRMADLIEGVAGKEYIQNELHPKIVLRGSTG